LDSIFNILQSLSPRPTRFTE